MPSHDWTASVWSKGFVNCSMTGLHRSFNMKDKVNPTFWHLYRWLAKKKDFIHSFSEFQSFCCWCSPVIFARQWLDSQPGLNGSIISIHSFFFLSVTVMQSNSAPKKEDLYSVCVETGVGRERDLSVGPTQPVGNRWASCCLCFWLQWNNPQNAFFQIQIVHKKLKFTNVLFLASVFFPP